MQYKYLLALILGATLSMSGFAQGQAFAILESTPSARATAMGGTMLGYSQSHHLYNNPASVLYSTQRVSIDISTELYPQSAEGRLKQYTLSAGYQFGQSRQAIFVGARRLAGLSVPANDSKGNVYTISPYEQTLDLAYALAVTKGLSFYASGSYIQSFMGTRAKGLSLSAGISYQTNVRLGKQSSILNLGLRLMDAGQPIKFNDTKLPYQLPTSLAMGGDWSVRLATKHRLTYAMSARFFTSESYREHHIGLGGEYTYRDMLSARLGYQFCRYADNRLNMGLGLLFKGFRLDMAYSHTTAIHGVDTFSCGLGLDL